MEQLCDPAHVGAVPSLVRYDDGPEHKWYDHESEPQVKTQD